MIYLKYLKQLTLRLLLVMALLTLLRVVYYFYNSKFFPVPSTSEAFSIFLGGLRFDMISVLYVNALFIIMSVLPVPFRESKAYNTILKVLFILFNALFFLVELGDMFYFQFVLRRINGSDISFLLNSYDKILPVLLENFAGILIFALLVYLLFFIYKKTEIKVPAATKRNYAVGIAVFILTVAFAIIGTRGGIQLRPLSPIAGAKYVKRNELLPLVTNGMVHLIFSTEQKFLKKKNYFSPEKAYSIFNPVKKGKKGAKMLKKNVFVIALESFGKEYIYYFNKKLGKSYTPFLDSLIEKSYLFENAYAAGKRSPHGIAALGAGIPALMDEPLSFSPYQSNCIDGMGTLFAKEGYTTAFFHGAKPSSMNIDRLGKLEGFQQIFTLEDVKDASDHTGAWGVCDDYFFQFTINKINNIKKPFAAFLFSLSSHHPYIVEKWFEDKYPDEDPILRATHYTDYALSRFFKEAKKQKWFDNTIFIITADHIGQTLDKKYTTAVNKYGIPFMIYTADSTWQGKDSTLFFQIDMLPTILTYMNYPHDYISFGVDAFDKDANHYAYTFSNGIYQIMDNRYILFFDGVKTTGFYDYKNDNFLTNNILKRHNARQIAMEDYLKAVIQIHNELMIENKLCIINFNKKK